MQPKIIKKIIIKIQKNLIDEKSDNRDINLEELYKKELTNFVVNDSSIFAGIKEYFQGKTRLKDIIFLILA